MKKLLILTSYLVFAICSAEAQKPEIARVLIHYKFSHLRDTAHRDNPYKENMALLLGKTASVYKSYDRQLEDALFRKQMQDQIAGSPDGNIKINRQNIGTSTQYFEFPEGKKLFRKERLFNPYLIEEPLPVIDWKISADTASFGGLHCQKATTHFKGRDYIAWFCPDLPFHGGPWKLNGLPGPFIKFFEAQLGGDALFQLAGEEGCQAMVTCCAAFYDGTTIITARGEIMGTVVATRGQSGFGFDKCLVPDGSHKTFGQMSSAEKDAFSHRGKAVKALLSQLKEL